ncbi:MAG TPA: SRPBCC domain-containing protein [Acidimicrobiales bacterium]
MTVTAVDKDLEQLTMCVTTELDVPVTRAWQLWADPRQLERWWGPPTYPATFVDHDLTPGGRCTYFMTGPEGDQPRGWWRILTIDAPNSLELEDGFADEQGNPNDDLPVSTMRLDLTERAGGGTTMTIVTRFPSVDDMQRILDMGMEEGITAAINQMEGILAG